MNNVLFICAMEKEGKQMAQKFGMKEISDYLYGVEDKKMLISGIGKQLTAISLMQYLSNNKKPDLIINIGYAGSTDIPVGSWVNITRAYNYEWEIPGEEKYVMLAGGSQKLETINNENVMKVECYSSESFVVETDIEETVAFDMELHSISLICDLYDIPLMSLKKISDNLSLEKYYDNIETSNVFELESCLDFLNL